jgi:hypothetical protein
MYQLETNNRKNVTFFSENKQMIQPKLKIGQPDDKNEKEADAVADRVMNMHQSASMQMQPLEEVELLQPKLMMHPISEGKDIIQMKCTECEEEEMLQTKSKQPVKSDNISDYTRSQINNTRGFGMPMDKQTRSFMENRFGDNFTNIKIHTNNTAVGLNRDLNSRAFTVGNDIYFDKGNYNPASSEGKRLLAHELTHTIQQGAGIQPTLQKDDNETTSEDSSGSSTPLADLISGIVRDQLSNSSMRGHLSSLGTALQGLAVESTTEGGDQPVSGTERMAALGISRAFETTSAAILSDPGFVALRQRIVDIIGGSDEAAFIAALAAALAAILADVPFRASPSQDLGAGVSVGGSFDLGSIQSLQFNNLQLYAQYASEYFRTRISGSLSRDAETEEFSGTGTGEVRIGSDISHLMGRLTINSEGEVVIVGRFSGGIQFGGSDRIVLTTDLTHSFASGETIIQPGVSGRFSLGSDQALRIGSSLSISTDSGLTGVTGFVEYDARFLRLRVEGSMTGLAADRGMMPGGDTRVQGMLTIPLF